MLFEQLREDYRYFYDAFVQMHKDSVTNGKGHAGHGIDHDLMVASYCLLIADDPKVREMAWVAALLHSIDRFFEEKALEKIDEMLVFVSHTFNQDEIKEIKLAVLRHDKPNQNDDSPTQIVLQDADRLANMGPVTIIRSGQARPTLPAINLGATGASWEWGSTYKAPLSVKDELIGHLEWKSDPKFNLRTPEAQIIGSKYFDFLNEFFYLMNQQFVETRLDKFKI